MAALEAAIRPSDSVRTARVCAPEDYLFLPDSRGSSPAMTKHDMVQFNAFT
jgi:hypothetical protein